MTFLQPSENHQSNLYLDCSKSTNDPTKGTDSSTTNKKSIKERKKQHRNGWGPRLAHGSRNLVLPWGTSPESPCWVEDERGSSRPLVRRAREARPCRRIGIRNPRLQNEKPRGGIATSRFLGFRPAGVPLVLSALLGEPCRLFRRWRRRDGRMYSRHTLNLLSGGY